MRLLRATYSVWFAVWVVAYALYFGPTSFLWVCCLTNVVVLAGFWLNRPALFSDAAIAVLGVQLVWLCDLLGRWVTGSHPLGVTHYLFNAKIPLFIRLLSAFHGWMPVLLVFLVYRLGYARGSLHRVALTAVVLFPLCSLIAAPAAGATALAREVNINWVHGVFDVPSTRGTMMDLLLALTGYLVVLVIPAHLALRRLVPQRERTDGL